MATTSNGDFVHAQELAMETLRSKENPKTKMDVKTEKEKG